MRVGASELASLGAGGRYDELASALCMAGGSGWRLPSLMESAGLVADGSEVRVMADDVDAFEVAGAADEILFSPPLLSPADAAALGGTVFAGLHGVAAGDDFPRLARAFRQASGVAAFRGDESSARADVACVRPEDFDSYFIAPDPAGISLTIVSSVVAYDSTDSRTLAFRISILALWEIDSVRGDGQFGASGFEVGSFSRDAACGKRRGLARICLGGEFGAGGFA